MPFESVLYATISTLCFTVASLYYREFSNKVSPFWINGFKTVVATLAFFALNLWTGELFLSPPSKAILAILFLSGILGLSFGDLFVMRAYSRMGPARTMLVFRIQPILLGFAGAGIFGEHLSIIHVSAILLMIVSVFLVGLERYRLERHWEGTGIAWAGLAIVGDTLGILLVKWALNADAELAPTEAIFYRCFGATLGLFLLKPSWPGFLRHHWKRLDSRDRARAFSASFMGMVLSLGFWILSVASGPAVVVSAIGGIGPILALILESLIERKRPSLTTVAAFLLSLVGFLFLIGF